MLCKRSDLADIGRWTVCSWAFVRSPVPLFWNIYQRGRATAGGGRDDNLERISRSLIFVYTSENVRQRLLWAFWPWPFSNLHRLGDAATRCLAVLKSHKGNSHRGLFCLPVSVSGCSWKCVVHDRLVTYILYRTSVHQESILFSQMLCNAKNRMYVCDTRVESITQKLRLRHLHKR